jgi:hypothetical protein
MITLHNAVIPFDGQPIEITDPKSISDFFIDHSLVDGDCTRVECANGAVFLVQETVEEIAEMIKPGEQTCST